jgi:hypothetical protein
VRVKFVGDPLNGGEGPPVVVMQGVEFPRSKWVSVDGASSLARKLALSSHFQVQAERPRRKPAGG